MPLPPSKTRKRVWCPSLPGRSFEDDIDYLRAHVLLGKPVDGAFLSWVLDTLEGHRQGETDDVEELRRQISDAEDEAGTAVSELEEKTEEFDKLTDRADALLEVVHRFLTGKAKKADLQKAHDDYEGDA